MSQPSHDDALKLLAAYTRKEIRNQILTAAREQGFREDAMDIIQSRAEAAFSLNANGDLRGPNGLTPTGWVSFVLPTEIPYALTPKDQPTESGEAARSDTPTPSGTRETARERLDRANGVNREAGLFQ